MSFTNLVQCILKKKQNPDDHLALNALSVLEQEIKYDLTQAFQLSRSLVEGHPTLFWDSRSYFDFLMKVSKLPSLDDLSHKDLSHRKEKQKHVSHATRELEKKNEEMSTLQQQLERCNETLNTRQKDNSDLKLKVSELSAKLERTQHKNTQLTNENQKFSREIDRLRKAIQNLNERPEPEETLTNMRVLSVHASMDTEQTPVEPEQLNTIALSGNSQEVQQLRDELDQLESTLNNRNQSIQNLHSFIYETYTEIRPLYSIVSELMKERSQAQQRHQHDLYSQYQALRSYFTQQIEQYHHVTTDLHNQGLALTDLSEILPLDAEMVDLNQETESCEMDDETEENLTETQNAIVKTAYSHYRNLRGNTRLDEYILQNLTDDLKRAEHFKKALPQNKSDALSMDSIDLSEDESSDFLKRIVQAAGFSCTTNEAIVKEIVDSIKRWKDLETVANRDTEDEQNVEQMEERIQMYDRLVKNIPLLTSSNVSNAFIVPFETLQDTLRYQRIEGINLENDDWFYHFVVSFISTLLQFLNHLETLSPEIAVPKKTRDWFFEFRKKFKALRDNEEEWNGLYSSWLEKLRLDPCVSKNVFIYKLGVKRDASHLELDEALCQKKVTWNDEKSQREYLAIENLIYALYKHYFKLKLEMYKADWKTTLEIQEHVKLKLDLLSKLHISFDRPNQLVEICMNYVTLDLNAAIGQDVVSELEYKDELLEKCMKDTMTFIENWQTMQRGDSENLMDE